MVNMWPDFVRKTLWRRRQQEALAQSVEELTRQFRRLSDPSGGQEVENSIDQYLTEVMRNKEGEEFSRVMDLLLVVISRVEPKAFDVATRWLRTLIPTRGLEVKKHLGGVVGALLPLLTSEEAKTREAAQMTNELLRRFVPSPFENDTLSPLILALSRVISAETGPSRHAGLKWIKQLVEGQPAQMLPILKFIFPCLLHALDDASTEVTGLAVELQIFMIDDVNNFDPAMSLVIDHFCVEPRTYSSTTSSAVRKYVQTFGPEKVFTQFATILASWPTSHENTLKGVVAVQGLTRLLVGAPELLHIRNLLRQAREVEESRNLFVALLEGWKYSPVDSIMLCLIAKDYAKAATFLEYLPMEQLPPEFNAQMNRFANYFDSSALLPVRMELMDPQKQPAIIAVLQPLIQRCTTNTKAFKSLRSRVKDALQMSSYVYGFPPAF